MTYEIRFSELNYGIARVDAKSKEEAEEMALEIYNKGKVKWIDSEITEIAASEVEHELLRPGDTVLVLDTGYSSLHGNGKIVWLADDDYPNTKDLFIVDFGDAHGTDTVHRDQMKKI